MQTFEKIRKNTGLSQQDIQELTGLDQSQISSLESGRFVPKTKTKRKLEIVLGSIYWPDEHKFNPTTYIDVQKAFINFHKALNGLPEIEKSQFITSTLKYLKNLKT